MVGRMAPHPVHSRRHRFAHPVVENEETMNSLEELAETVNNALARIELLETVVAQQNQCINILEELNPEALESHTKENDT